MALRILVAAALCACLAYPLTPAQELDAASTAKRLLLLGQKPDGHPPATHEYHAGLKILKELLARTPQLKVEMHSADDPWTEGPELLRRADGAVLFLAEGARWVNGDPRRLDAWAQLAQRGGGLCVLHWGMGTREAAYIEPFVKLFGMCHGGPDRKYQVLSVTAQPTEHAICRGLAPFKVQDEFYYRLKRVAADATGASPEGLAAVLRVPIDGQDETVAWAWERPGGGRSFGFSGLHFHENWKLEPYRRLVLQGVLWSMKVEIPQQGAEVSIPKELLELPPGTGPRK